LLFDRGEISGRDAARDKNVHATVIPSIKRALSHDELDDFSFHRSSDQRIGFESGEKL
jgi:hypothetical protein